MNMSSSSEYCMNCMPLSQTATCLYVYISNGQGSIGWILVFELSDSVDKASTSVAGASSIFVVPSGCVVPLANTRLMTEWAHAINKAYAEAKAVTPSCGRFTPPFPDESAIKYGEWRVEAAEVPGPVRAEFNRFFSLAELAMVSFFPFVAESARLNPKSLHDRARIPLMS